MKNSDKILAIQETLEVVEETIGETPLVTIIVAIEENNALRLTTTIGPVLSARTLILHSAKYAIAVKRLGLAVVALRVSGCTDQGGVYRQADRGDGRP